MNVAKLIASVLAAIARARKALAAVAGGVAMVIASGVLSGDALVAATGVLAVLTTLGVYHAPNAPANPPAAPYEPQHNAP